MAKMLPFNIEIPRVTKATVQNLAHVTSSDIFVGATKVLHPEGLFSIENFGRLGDDVRTQQFGYIDIKIRILHPIVYDRVKRLKALYERILTGRGYALWDEQQNDFIAASEMEGSTGASFFLRHWKDIQFKRTKSLERNQRIDVIEKYRDVALTDHILVLPAGLRDIEITDDGRVEENEINALYRKLITVSNTVAQTNLGDSSPVLDATRSVLQSTFNEIYDTLFTMVKGKRGFMEKKFASRKVMYGTRNVFTAMNVRPKTIGQPNSPSYTDTIIGLYQLMRSMTPVVIHKLLKYMSGRFNRQSGQSMLYDPKTLRRMSVELKSDELDRYTTVEGLDKFMSVFKIAKKRHDPVMVGKYALGLIYVDDQDNFMFVDDIDQLPDNLDRNNVRPITYAELFYLCNYQGWKEPMITTTRYPITGEGSIYPASPYVITTMRGQMRYELDPTTGERYGETHIALEFPTLGMPEFLESIVPHLSRLDGMGGDYDGDMGSNNVAYSEESKREKEAYFKTKRAFVTADGRLRANLGVQVFKLFLHNFTWERV